MMGVKRFPCDDTIRNFFMKFGMGETRKFFEPLWRWMLARVAIRAEGYSLDLDLTVFQRYGEQEGSLKGHNPKKHAGPSHHPILAVLAEAYFVLHGWMRSGNADSSWHESASARAGLPLAESSLTFPATHSASW
jgi:hypothetical protein